MDQCECSRIMFRISFLGFVEGLSQPAPAGYPRPAKVAGCAGGCHRRLSFLDFSVNISASARLGAPPSHLDVQRAFGLGGNLRCTRLFTDEQVIRADLSRVESARRWVASHGSSVRRRAGVQGC